VTDCQFIRLSVDPLLARMFLVCVISTTAVTSGAQSDGIAGLSQVVIFVGCQW